MFLFCIFAIVLVFSELAATYAVACYQKVIEQNGPATEKPKSSLSTLAQNVLVAFCVVLGGMLIVFLSGGDIYSNHAGSMKMIVFTVVAGAVANAFRLTPEMNSEAPIRKTDWGSQIKLFVVAVAARKLVVGISFLLLFGAVILFAIFTGKI